jgi:site-specific recombinase XerD
MTLLAPTLQAFFTDRLATQRQASPHTVAAYRDTFRLLLRFVAQETGKAPSRLDLADVDARLVGRFLDHLEQQRHNSARTRNARLAAIHALFRYAALRHPEHAELIQRVLAIPHKRFDRAIVCFLAREEVEALLAAPGHDTRTGRRDHALLHVAVQTGLRVSELTGLTRGDVHLGTGAHLKCRGKNRKHRSVPLTAQTVRVLTAWLRECPGGPDDPLFPSNRGGRLSRDAVEWLLSKYVATATTRCPSLHSKNITPHVLRHTAAMNLLQAGVDTSVIALWLGHEGIETTNIYLHADLRLKEQALARTAPSETPAGRYQAPDTLLAFLDDL